MRGNYKDKPRRDHYAEVTEQIVSAMEQGRLPWRQPWEAGLCGDSMLPRNAVTGHRYRGINQLVLSMSPQAAAEADPRWCTYKQAQDHGWQVRGGSRGTPVYFYKPLKIYERGGASADGDVSDGRSEALDAMGQGGDDMGETVRTKTVRIMRSYTVFHASQIEGIPPYEPPAVPERAWTPEETAEHILRESGARIIHGGEEAYYSPVRDEIHLPPQAAFKSATGYYGVALHELSHWTGHSSRLDRSLINVFGSPGYALEELRAELSSVFLGMETGIEPDLRQAAAYLQDWVHALKSNPREIFRAAADAQRATEYVLTLANLGNDIEFDAEQISLPGEDDDPDITNPQSAMVAAPARRGGMRP